MKIAFCTDIDGGISFNGRRVSRDAAILGDLYRHSGTVIAFLCSSEMFSKAGVPVEITGSITEVNDEALLFLEEEPTAFYESADEIIIYNFNRRYPSDVKVKTNPENSGFVLLKEEEFAGVSHNKITVKIYGRG